MGTAKALNRQRQRRVYRVRKRLTGSDVKPRLSVFRSNKNITAQLIDDETGRTLVSASTQEKSLASQIKFGGNIGAAATIGTTIANRAKEAGVSVIVFDRGPYKYHGRVQALAEAAREGGLVF